MDNNAVAAILGVLSIVFGVPSLWSYADGRLAKGQYLYAAFCYSVGGIAGAIGALAIGWAFPMSILRDSLVFIAIGTLGVVTARHLDELKRETEKNRSQQSSQAMPSVAGSAEQLPSKGAADIQVQTVDLAEPFSPGKRPQVVVTYKNVGTARGTLLRDCATIKVGTGPLPDTPPPIDSAQLREIRQDIAPGDTFVLLMTYRKPFTRNDCNRLAGRAANMYVYGWFEFQHSDLKDHSDFGYSYEPEGIARFVMMTPLAYNEVRRDMPVQEPLIQSVSKQASPTNEPAIGVWMSSSRDGFLVVNKGTKNVSIYRFRINGRSLKPLQRPRSVVPDPSGQTGLEWKTDLLSDAIDRGTIDRAQIVNVDILVKDSDGNRFTCPYRFTLKLKQFPLLESFLCAPYNVERGWANEN